MNDDLARARRTTSEETLETRLRASVLLGHFRQGWADAAAHAAGKRGCRPVLPQLEEAWWRRGYIAGKCALSVALDSQHEEALSHAHTVCS